MLPCCCEWIVSDGVDQTASQSFASVEFFSRKEHLQRPGLADKPRQALRASPAGDEAESCAAMTKNRMRAGNAAMAGERQIKSAAHAVAMNGGDGRSREVGDSVHQALSHLREAKGLGAVQFGNFVEIGSGGEEMHVAGDHESGGGFLCELLECLRQRGDSCACKAIGAAGRDQTQNNDVAMELDFARLFGGLDRRLWQRAD